MRRQISTHSLFEMAAARATALRGVRLHIPGELVLGVDSGYHVWAFVGSGLVACPVPFYFLAARGGFDFVRVCVGLRHFPIHHALRFG